MMVWSKTRAARMLLVVILLCGVSIWMPNSGQAAQGPPGMRSAEGPTMVLRAGNPQSDGRPGMVAPLPGVRDLAAAFQVTYVGDWDAAARIAFQHAVNIWSSQIDAVVPIEIVAHWESLPDYYLVRGGPTQVLSDFEGAPIARTWYPATLANQLAQKDLLPDVPDIEVTVNSAHSWYLGTDGAVPSSQFDLVTSALTGLGYGLGFVSSTDVVSEDGYWGWGTGYPCIYDRFVVNGAGLHVTDTGRYPNPSAALANQLTGDDLYFDGPHARAPHSGRRPKLFAPNPWQGGLSIAHLDEATYVQGSPNAFMTPLISRGEAIHAPGPAALGILEDLGWTTGAHSPSPDAMGYLEIHMPEALPPNVRAQPYVTVDNAWPAPAGYVVAVRLRQGSRLLGVQSLPVSFGWAGRQDLLLDFGILAPGRYSLDADLSLDGVRVDTHTLSFDIARDYLQLYTAVKDLTQAAYDECNQSEEIAVSALSTATVQAAQESVDAALDQLLSSLMGIARGALAGATELLPDDAAWALKRFSEHAANLDQAAGKRAYDPMSDFWHSLLEERTYGGTRDRIQSAESVLLDQAAEQAFTWSPGLQAEMARREIAIREKSESVQGMTLKLDANAWTPRRASLVEMKGQFDWIHDTFLPVADTVMWGLLFAFLAVWVIAALVTALKAGAFLALLPKASVVFARFAAAAYLQIQAAVHTLGVTKTVVAITGLAIASMLVAGTAESRVAPAIEQEHQEAMDYVRQRIRSEGRARLPSKVDLSAAVQGYEADLHAKLESMADDPSWFEIQLYRADGQLLEIADYGRLQPGAAASLDAKLAPGTYWAVGVAHGDEGVRVERRVFQAASADVTLDVALADAQLALGETLTATITVQNQDPVQGTGALALSAQVLNEERLAFWYLALGPGEQSTYSYSFVPAGNGGYVLSVAVSDEMGALDRQDRAFAVGTAPSVALNLAPEASYAPGDTVYWEITVHNAGTQAANGTIAVRTFDLNRGYTQVAGTARLYGLATGESTVLSIPVLWTALPSAYSTHLIVDDHLYRTDEFLVEAKGRLFAMLQVDPSGVAVSQPKTIQVEVQDESYDPIDADLTAAIRTPHAVAESVDFSRVRTGRYQLSYTPASPGTYTLQATASKPLYVDAHDRSFFIVERPSMLRLDAEDDILLDVPAFVRFRVRNELGLPVPDATVILQGEHGAVTGRTDEQGLARLFAHAEQRGLWIAQVERPGYAGSQLEIPVRSAIYLPFVLSN